MQQRAGQLGGGGDGGMQQGAHIPQGRKYVEAPGGLQISCKELATGGLPYWQAPKTPGSLYASALLGNPRGATAPHYRPSAPVCTAHNHPGDSLLGLHTGESLLPLPSFPLRSPSPPETILSLHLSLSVPFVSRLLVSSSPFTYPHRTTRLSAPTAPFDLNARFSERLGTHHGFCPLSYHPPPSLPLPASLCFAHHSLSVAYRPPLSASLVVLVYSSKLVCLHRDHARYPIALPSSVSSLSTQQSPNELDPST
jgi:hypothetical protein